MFPSAEVGYMELNHVTLIDDVNPSRSLLCEAEQRSMRSKNDSSRGASKRRSPPTCDANPSNVNLIKTFLVHSEADL